MPNLIAVILVLIVGSCLGSFFNVCIYRIPIKKSIVFPPSYCPACSKPIPAWLNIPILGYLLSAGKCKNCKQKIHWHYILVESVAALIFLVLFLRLGGQFSFLFFKYAVFFSFGLIIFFIDLFHQIVPDGLSLPLIPLGLIAALLPANEIGVLSSGVGMAAGFSFFYAIAYSYWKITGKMGLGGGDIKLIAGIGAFVGVAGLLFTILVSSVIAFLFILILRHDVKKELSFAPFLISGVFLYIIFGVRLITWYANLF